MKQKRNGNRRLRREKIAQILTAAGLIDSTYLIYTNFHASSCSFEVCSLSSPFFPPYLPALLGLLWFTFSALVFSKRVSGSIVEVWRVSGVAGASYFGTYALLNHYYCPFCFTAYAIGFLLIWLSKDVQ